MATKDVLDLMVASVVKRKAEAGAKLTPVGLEAPAATLPPTAASFPNDVPDEAILQRVSILEDLYGKLAELDERTEALFVQVRVQYTAIRDALDAVKGVLKPVAEAAVGQVQDRERAADAAAALRAAEDDTQSEDPDAELPSQAVIASMMQQIITALPATVTTPATGWQCSEHQQHIVKTSRLGREYRACPAPGCTQFERL